MANLDGLPGSLHYGGNYLDALDVPDEAQLQGAAEKGAIVVEVETEMPETDVRDFLVEVERDNYMVILVPGGPGQGISVNGQRFPGWSSEFVEIYRAALDRRPG